mmetsp:Transcript_46590/g.150287  ORF Transcript_46590/g.150287 Transcript_46590/m.150287 type:complete len:89 (+) Transcript_46590:939-1205(+)
MLEIAFGLCSMCAHAAAEVEAAEQARQQALANARAEAKARADAEAREAALTASLAELQLENAKLSQAARWRDEGLTSQLGDVGQAGTS